MSVASRLRGADEWCRQVKKLSNEGFVEEAILWLKSREQEHVISFLLQECMNKRDLSTGRALYDLLTRSNAPLHAYVGSYLIRMFDACDSLVEANQVFETLRTHNCYTWSAIILAHTNHGNTSAAIQLYCNMHHSGRKPDGHTYVAVLKACIISMDLALGKVIHCHVVESCLELDVVIGNMLVDMYAKCGSVLDGRNVFGMLLERDAISWNAMIGAYTHKGLALEASSLFRQMQQESVQPDTFTLVSILKACFIMQALYQAKFVHSIAHSCGFASSTHVGTALIDMYSKCGHILHARKLFDDLPIRNLVTWNVMITGYVQQACYNEALFLYYQLQEDAEKLPDCVTYLSILKACSSLVDVDFGKVVHDCIVKQGFDLDVFVGNTLIDMYSKCGNLEEAQNVFYKLATRDVVSWNAIISAYSQQGHDQAAFWFLKLMKQAAINPDTATWNVLIAGYAQHGQGKEALKMFKLMQCDQIKPDNLTFSSTVKACSSIIAVDQGKLLHSYAIESGATDAFVESALVDMYMKSGSREDALQAFRSFSQGDVVTCNAMLIGYALRDEYNLALCCYEDMRRQGLKPDKVTFIGLLSLCSRLGLVEDACQHIKTMTSDCGLAPNYSCIIDILGRIGRLNEARELLQTIPSGHNMLHWISLLTNCKVYGDIGLGNHCFDQIAALDRTFGSAYVLLSNIYAEALLYQKTNMLIAKAVPV